MTAAATILQVERRLASAERLSSGKRWGRFERVQDGFCPLLSCPKPKVWARPPVPPTGVFPQPDGEQPLLLTDGAATRGAAVDARLFAPLSDSAPRILTHPRPPGRLLRRPAAGPIETRVDAGLKVPPPAAIEHRAAAAPAAMVTRSPRPPTGRAKTCRARVSKTPPRKFGSIFKSRSWLIGCVRGPSPSHDVCSSLCSCAAFRCCL